MKCRVILSVLWISISMQCPANGAGRDWFVRPGSTGDGTRERPFNDPHLALEEAGPGDTLHVAQGIYHGKLKSANWVISIPNLTWLGGYNHDFTRRDPWRLPSELRFSKEFTGRNSGTLINGGTTHDQFVLDGFLLDQKEFNEYETSPCASLSSRNSDFMVRLSGTGIQIRNCVLLNGSHGGVELSGGGGRFENNIVLNMDRAPLLSVRSREGAPTVIQGNTFLFSWSDSIGSGGSPAGRGVSFWSGDGEFEITANIFLGCDGWALDAARAEKLALKRNVFWLNASSNVKVHAREKTVHVRNSTLGDLEDAGLKALEDNVATDPQLTGLDVPWMEKFLERVAADYPDLKLEDVNAIRSSLGLTALKGLKAANRPCRAMAYDAAQAVKIVPAHLKQGAHPVPLEVKPFINPPPSITHQYAPATWQQLAENPKSIHGRRVEIAGALGEEQSDFGFEGITQDQYRGFRFHDVQERLGQMPVLYFQVGSKAERGLRGLESWDGNGKPREKHLVRGLVRYDAEAKGTRKGTLIVEAVHVIPESRPVESKPRPSGRDWFVRAGASGRGTKADPFKDPWQALEAAKPGDAIHVAEGEYFGKLKTAVWKIQVPYLSVLGGYDKQFQERDPWKHPSRLSAASGESRPSSTSYVVGEADHTGLIFDGFVLDGREGNQVDDKGNLRSRFPEWELMTLFSPDVTIRNCTLLNAGGAAIQASGDNTRIENNLILNCNYYALNLSRHVTDHPFIVRSNTILFTWHASRDGRPNSGGTAVVTFQGTRLELANNLIGFADGQAVRNSEPRRLKVTNNVFTRNRFANFTDLDRIVVTDQNMDLLKELGLAASEGNVVLDPQMTFEPTWWADYNRQEGPGFFARPYDWKAALQLVPQNPACQAGARPVKLEVRFNP